MRRQNTVITCPESGLETNDKIMKKNIMVTSGTVSDQQLGFISKLKVDWWKVEGGCDTQGALVYFVVSAQCVSKLDQANLLCCIPQKVCDKFWKAYDWER